VVDLSFTVEAGQVSGFVGPNGSGKSTTMRMIVGLDAPSSWTVTVEGRTDGNLRFPLHDIGNSLDVNAVHPGRSARSYLVWLADSNSIPRRLVDEVLSMFGMTEAGDRRLAPSPSGWVSAWESQQPCGATPGSPSSTRPSTGWIRRGSSECVTCSADWPRTPLALATSNGRGEHQVRFHVARRELLRSSSSGRVFRRRPHDVYVNGVRYQTSAGDQRDISEVAAHQISKIRGEFSLDREVQDLITGAGEVHDCLDRCQDRFVKTAVGQCVVHVIAEPLAVAVDRRRK